MPYRITVTADAEAQMKALTARERRMLEAAVLSKLRDRPTTPTRAIKKLRPNPFAQFELRVGNLRVLYDVGEGEVLLHTIGRKIGNRLVVEGEDFHEHQDDPA
jgi:mRNA-degrading endonuclease RelE of RelBE toxin-antitoxin system